MVVMLHIFIAVASVGLATAALVKPSSYLLVTNYALVVLTLISGIFLAVLEPAAMTRVCIAGFAYAVGVTSMLLGARAKLHHLRRLEKKV